MGLRSAVSAFFKALSGANRESTGDPSVDFLSDAIYAGEGKDGTPYVIKDGHTWKPGKDGRPERVLPESTVPKTSGPSYRP